MVTTGLFTAIIDTSTVALQPIVAAVPGKRIQVLGLELYPVGAAEVVFKSATTALTAGFPLTAASGPVVLPTNENGWFETAQGAALNMDQLQAVRVTGIVRYTLI